MTVTHEVLAPEEAAQLLRISKKTLLRHARQGTVPGLKLGRVWRFRRTELLKLLATEETS